MEIIKGASKNSSNKENNVVLKIRQIKERVAFFIVITFALCMAIPLFAIIGEVIYNGIGGLNLDFFTKIAPSTYEAMLANENGTRIPGGIVNGITGTIYMVALASAFAIPLGILTGIFLSQERRSWLANVIRFLTELIQSTPSIIVGIIVYGWVVVPLKSYSTIAGAIALGVMMLPLVARSTEETLKMLPPTLKEAALDLGGSYQSVVLKVLLPSAGNGIITGVLLAISRVIGETAPLMITALGSTLVNWDITAPSSAVPLLIWEFYNDPNLVSLIWSSALSLLILVLALNLAAKYIIHKRDF